MQTLKKIILFFSGFVLIILISLFIILNCFENEIYKFILSQINKNINTEISFDKTKLLLYQYFPNAAMSFYNVKINVNKNFSFNKTDTLKSNNVISADLLTVKFSILSLLKNPVTINAIEIKNGLILIFENLHNDNNYLLIKNLSKNSDSLIFQIHKLKMNSVHFIYFNEKNGIYINSFIKDLNIRGKIQNNYSNFRTSISPENICVLYKNFKYNIRNILDLSFATIIKPYSIVLNDGLININNELFKFKASCLISNMKKYNFTFHILKFNLGGIHKFNINIPKEIFIKKGTISLYINFFWNDKQKSPLCFSAFSSINNLAFTYNKYDLNNINFQSKINGEYLNTLKAKFSSKEINGDYLNSYFDISDIKYQTFNDSLTGRGLINIKCNDLNNLFADSIINFNNGKIRISFLLKSKISQLFKNNLLNDLKISDISTYNITCTLFKGNYSLKNLNSESYALDKKFKIAYLKCIINNNDINFSGNLNNYQSLFIDSSSKIEIDGTLNGKLLNFNSFITNNKSVNNENSIKPRNHFFLVNLNLNYDSVIFDNFIFNNSHSKFHYSYGLYLFNNINTTFCEGIISEGILKVNTDSNLLSLTTNCNFKSIDIEQLFKRFNDFGQNEITSKNIKGKFNGNAFCKLIWKNNIFLKEDFYGTIDFEIINGELNGFEPVYKLSRYIDIKELNSVKFKKLSNKIIISNKIVNIPLMNLDNSALNLTLSGSHSFENEYEYHFKVILSNLLLKKQINKMRKNNDYFQTEDDTLRTIYMKLIGNNNSYKITYDGKLALQAFSDKMKSEKKQIKKIFNQEFGLFKYDSSTKNNTNKLKNKIIIESEEMSTEKKHVETDKKAKKKKENNKIEWKDE